MIYAVLWSTTAFAIAYWLNKLILSAALVELIGSTLRTLVSPVMEESAKYLAIRNARQYSLVVPLLFLVAEAAIHSITPYGGIPGELWMISTVFGLVTLKHVLFYTVVYLLDYKLYSLPLAIIVHVIWNWYVRAPKGEGILPLGVICMMVVTLPALTLWKFNRRN